MSTAPEPLCLLDGQIVALAEARISPLDRGFLFGDAVYEAVKVVSGELLFLERHSRRLAASLAALSIPQPRALAADLRRLVVASRLGAGVVYLQVTRGAAPRRSHRPPPGLTPTVFALPIAIDFPAHPEREPGLVAITRRDDRWRHCDVKTTALAASVLAALAGARAGADEALFVGDQGELREGAHTNLFVRDERGWHTHPLGPQVLAGVTRAILLEEAGRSAPAESDQAAQGAEDEPLPAVEERAPRLERRADWREAFVCGTTTGVRGIVEVDGAAVGDRAVGPETRRFALALARLERAAAARGKAEAR